MGIVFVKGGMRRFLHLVRGDLFGYCLESYFEMMANHNKLDFLDAWNRRCEMKGLQERIYIADPGKILEYIKRNGILDTLTSAIVEFNAITHGDVNMVLMVEHDGYSPTFVSIEDMDWDILVRAMVSFVMNGDNDPTPPLKYRE